jgi:hypothetical protein
VLASSGSTNLYQTARRELQPLSYVVLQQTNGSQGEVRFLRFDGAVSNSWAGMFRMTCEDEQEFGRILASLPGRDAS